MTGGDNMMTNNEELKKFWEEWEEEAGETGSTIRIPNLTPEEKKQEYLNSAIAELSSLCEMSIISANEQKILKEIIKILENFDSLKSQEQSNKIVDLLFGHLV